MGSGSEVQLSIRGWTFCVYGFVGGQYHLSSVFDDVSTTRAVLDGSFQSRLDVCRSLSLS
jgi:hypothetical protein